MNTLEQIIAFKKTEVAELKTLYPVKLLERSPHFTAPVVSLKKYIRRPDKSGIIAEIKRKSPSAGWINPHISVERTSVGYMQAGASALSVLTDRQFFGGDNKDLGIARRHNYCPLLRKDFIVDEYQVVEARSAGADAILLIAAVLSVARIRELAAFARSLGLEVVLEVHSREELDALNAYTGIVGVNNRDLKDFSVDTNRSFALLPFLEGDLVKISESGIEHPQTAADLRRAGYDGFLVGSGFMRHSRPEAACALFIKQYKQLIHEN